MKADTTGGEIVDTGTLEIETAVCFVTPSVTGPLAIEFPLVNYTWGMGSRGNVDATGPSNKDVGCYNIGVPKVG